MAKGQTQFVLGPVGMWVAWMLATSFYAVTDVGGSRVTALSLFGAGGVVGALYKMLFR